jgi:hypothetical protein
MWNENRNNIPKYTDEKYQISWLAILEGILEKRPTSQNCFFGINIQLKMPSTSISRKKG